jgi:hypothetical protein
MSLTTSAAPATAQLASRCSRPRPTAGASSTGAWATASAGARVGRGGAPPAAQDLGGVAPISARPRRPPIPSFHRVHLSREHRGHTVYGEIHFAVVG